MEGEEVVAGCSTFTEQMVFLYKCEERWRRDKVGKAGRDVYRR